MSAPSFRGFWKSGAEQGVVADQHRALTLPSADLVRDAPHEGDVDEGVHRVRRGLDGHDRNAAPTRRRVRGLADAGLIHPVAEANAVHAEVFQGSWR
jgi:hypothetical protein